MSVVTLRQWGNSVGFRIPANQLAAAHAEVGEQFELNVSKEGVFTLAPLKYPQAGWQEAFNKIADAGYDEPLLGDMANDFDNDDWTW